MSDLSNWTRSTTDGRKYNKTMKLKVGSDRRGNELRRPGSNKPVRQKIRVEGDIDTGDYKIFATGTKELGGKADTDIEIVSYDASKDKFTVNNQNKGGKYFNALLGANSGKNSNKKKIPCFGVLGNLILSFSKLLNQKASHEPSGQHALNDEYYERIEAIQFTMNHDDGKSTKDIEKSDIILVGVSRTSKTPTSIYLANRGFKTSNIPLVNKNSLPKKIKDNPRIACVVGLTTEPERLVEIRRNRMNSLKETENTNYTNIENITKEIIDARKTFQKYSWPVIDVTRKSVEEAAASIIKIYEIYSQNNE